MKILFMGTPDFAVFSLDALVASGENVVGVVTQPDKMQGRGYKLTPSPVKARAAELGIPVYTPATLRGDDFAALLSGIDPDLIVVAAFGKILPHNVISYSRFGCINVHGSLLPEYRGAAPMQRAVIDGKKFTGITTMMMDDGLDTGDILLTRRVDIGDDDDFEVVHDKMAEAGAELLIETLTALKNGTLVRIPQSDIDLAPTYASKIEKSDCIIDFSKPANTIHDLIRGLSPVPLALTRTPDGKLLKIIKSSVKSSASSAVPGTVVALDGGITVACGSDGSERVTFLRVLPEGKSRMDASDFIRGRKISVGDVLEY